MPLRYDSVSPPTAFISNLNPGVRGIQVPSSNSKDHFKILTGGGILVDAYAFSVKAFGAVGNATYGWMRGQANQPTPTDDTIAVQDAIDTAQSEGLPLYLPFGYYRITAPLVISKGYGMRMMGEFFQYVTLSAFTAGIADKFRQSILVRDFDGPLLTIRGRNSANDADASEYDLSVAYRHSGTVLSGIQLMSRSGNASTAPALVLKRLARCHFDRVVIYSQPGRAIDATSVDDSTFNDCYFYVCGNTTSESAVLLRRGATIGSDDVYASTNTISFQRCTWEGNGFGNLEVSNAASGDAGNLVGLTMRDVYMKGSLVTTNGVTPFNLYACNTMVLSGHCNIGTNSGSALTATEIAKFDTCSGAIVAFQMQQIGNANLTLTRYITVVGCTGINFNLSLFSPFLPSGAECVNQSTSTQITATGNMRFPTTAGGKILIN